MSKSHFISSSDLESYIDSNIAGTERHPLSNWMALQSQVYVKGISDLHKALDQDSPKTIEEIRRDYSASLLEDLERVSKRQDVHNDRVNIPDFEQVFYDEVSKPAAERSAKYNSFIETCCKEFTADRHLTEVISAQALLELGNSDLDYGTFKESMQSNIDKYQKAYTEQTLKDHDRGSILFKDSDGKTRHITVEQLMTSEEVTLTPEQRGFVQSSWQQGSFFCGWFNGLPESARQQKEGDERTLSPYNSPNFTQTFIDISDGDVKVYNRIEVSLIDLESMDISPFFEASITVDITKLTGDKFTIGCSTAKPEIQFNVEELDESMSLAIPETLKSSIPIKDISKYIKEDAAVGYLYMIENNIENGRAWNSLNALMGKEKALNYVVDNIEKDTLSADNKKELIEIINQTTENQTTTVKYSKAIELFNKLEPDKNARLGFAEHNLDKYLSSETSPILDKKELERIKSGIIEIMSPSCKSKAEQLDLEQNAVKIVRTCSAEKGQKMSFSQKWQRFKDKVGNIKNWIIGRDNKTRSIMQNHPEIVLKLKQHLQPTKARRQAPLVGRDKNKGVGR